jgi:3'-phosphoadenosine 5'-phosphosulfate (PAPS) 3'-phosphatase
MDTPLRNIEMEALRSEPALDEYFERVEGQHQGSQDQIEIRRSADIAFKYKENKNPAILVDVATKSILVSRLKTYKPGELADAFTTKKIKSYEKKFNINKTDRANRYFFTVE